jgi:quinol monooxygenase YgiN
MTPKLIKTEAEHEAALACVENLMDAEAGSDQEAELEVWGVLIEKYEEEHFPIDLPDPVAAIQFRMEQLGLTRKDLLRFVQTFINTFSVEPENADRLVENLQKATEDIFRDQPGFISANLHVSRDRRKVVNYAQWRSKEDYAAMSKLPGIQAHRKAAAVLATGFDPVDYDLRAVMFGESE